MGDQHHYHRWGQHKHGGPMPHLHGSQAEFNAAHQPTTALELREDIRAIMRAGGEVPAGIAERTWWPADLIREITEWHDAGRPDAAVTAGMVHMGTYPVNTTRPPLGEERKMTITLKDIQPGLSAWVDVEGTQYIAYCKELPVIGVGTTIGNAIDSLLGCLETYHRLNEEWEDTK